MATPHKHAQLIKAWADGALIEQNTNTKNGWVQVAIPLWQENLSYRIKPEPKPDVIEERRVELVEKSGDGLSYLTWYQDSPNVRYVFDGETKKLKSVFTL